MACTLRIFALCCALVVVTTAAYTVDCNHEYTDCDTELSKLVGEEDEGQSATTQPPITEVRTTTAIPPTRSTTTTNKNVEQKTDPTTTEQAVTEVVKQPRLLNLNVEELQNFANALHNQTNQREPKKNLADLSDVNMDGEDDDELPKLPESKQKQISDKFYSNLQAPFNPLQGIDKSEEIETCKENEITYKVGEKMDRGCEESCECFPGGVFECSPRCKHPYIRRGRRINDPLCFESPVDECCSIMACATNNGELKPTSLEICRYGNDTYHVGAVWNVGCEQSCVCEKNSVVTCKPRCKRLPQSERCINVQDPNDACCEIQICDVSQDVHEEPMDNVTVSSTTMPAMLQDLMESPKSTMRPLVLVEPIGSIKVLQNNSVQVNLIHPNDTEDPIHLLLSNNGGKTFEDVELIYTNLILNLEGGKDYILKTKETGTKFNFTITASDVGNEVPVEESYNSTKEAEAGCYHDGQFYEVGEEFHVGCSELCECTGVDARECAPLVCPNHVGLELVSKGCVKWAPNPPPQPPNCCPRTARCLSDGTCHFKGVPIPNWSEVPIALSGCEQHCFCENGELDCQEACNPLPPLPPQTLRCPPMHRPAPVNISDENCCKEWGCAPHAGFTSPPALNHETPHLANINFVTPITPVAPTRPPLVLPTPTFTTESMDLNKKLQIGNFDFYKRIRPVKTNIHKYLKSLTPTNNTYAESNEYHTQYQPLNITSVASRGVDSSLKQIEFAPEITNTNIEINAKQRPMKPPFTNSIKKSHSSIVLATHDRALPKKSFNRHQLQNNKHNIHSNIEQDSERNNDIVIKNTYENSPIRKVPLSQVKNLNYFLPEYHKKLTLDRSEMSEQKFAPIQSSDSQYLFEPMFHNISNNIHSDSYHQPHPYINSNVNQVIQNSHGKHVTILRNKDLPSMKSNAVDTVSWKPDIKHLLMKEPNPYETVLLRALPNTKMQSAVIDPIARQSNSAIAYSTIDLENILSQMEVESEVNRHLGRSAEKSRATAAGQLPPGFPGNPPQPPSFLPTIPPDVRYPLEDPESDQNNIHLPTNPLQPALAGLPPGLPLGSFGDENKKLTVISLQSDSPNSIKMLFGLPPVLVGLRGSVDLRYTDADDDDVSQWYSQVFAPADEILTTPRLEFRLGGLKPSTTYKIRGKLYLHNLPVEPESKVYTIRTQDLPATEQSEEKRREIDCKLRVVEVNDTNARVTWRHFTEEELQLIDGIQVRYRPVGTPIYSMTELLHHSRSAADLQELRPGSRYEASLVLIPPTRSATELYDSGHVEFVTAPYIDPYNWTVTVEARSVGSEAAELVWRGVPAPAERWVRVYRAAHACGARRGEHDDFRLAARDLPPAITLVGLEANSRCRVWLELFLTNGKVKTSNVLEINTKPLDSPEPVDNEIEASSIAGSRGAPRGDYYGALVIVGVVAALGALTSVLLLLVVIRRHRPHSVAITPAPTAPREASLPPYDNPAYKLELQQETMDL